MSVEEIFTTEKREENNLFEIYFHLEGTFWRAYEWSAYLSRNFPSTLSDEDRLKPLKKVAKSCEDGYVQVGLQMSSFEKYFPGVTKNDELFEIKDKQIIIHAKNLFDGIEFGNYEKLLFEWKNSVRLSGKEKKKSKELENEVYAKSLTIDDLVNEIVSYPMENRSLLQNSQFLSYIRDRISKIKNREVIS